MMYMFPRQFGLHNVFTSPTDRTQTSQRFQDYTLREKEIENFLRRKLRGKQVQMPKVPKRLRGPVEQLVRHLQILHSRCAYWELLRHYCPSEHLDPLRRSANANTGHHVQPLLENLRAPDSISSQHPSLQHSKRRLRTPHVRCQNLAHDKQTSVVDMATPSSQVSAFCQAVLTKVIPRRFWGVGDTASHNATVFLRKVNHFIKLRRFETMSLHEIVQDLKVSSVPNGLRNAPSR